MPQLSRWGKGQGGDDHLKLQLTEEENHSAQQTGFLLLFTTWYKIMFFLQPGQTLKYLAGQ